MTIILIIGVIAAAVAAYSVTPGAKPAKGATGATAAVLMAAAAFVGPWEGERTEAYLDRIAQPPVWTVCFGETRGVRQGDTFTHEECLDKLMAALADFRIGLVTCIPALIDQPEGVQVALISWSYNVGLGAACSSTLAAKANAGDWRGACNQLPRWNRAGGVTVRGLTNRRAAEQELCLGAL